MKVGVVIHIYYTEIADELFTYLKNIPFDFDLLITTSRKKRKKIFKLFARNFPKLRITVKAVLNRGTDIAPFICTFGNEYSKYDLVCKIHSKKSIHYGVDYAFGDEWRRYLLDNLMGSYAIVAKILLSFRKDEKIGMIFPETFAPIRSWVNCGVNWTKAKCLADKLNIKIDQQVIPVYPAGSMFWFRPKALQPLFELGLSFEDFEKYNKQFDGTLSHAIERLTLIIAESEGFVGKQVSFGKYKPNNL